MSSELYYYTSWKWMETILICVQLLCVSTNRSITQSLRVPTWSDEPCQSTVNSCDSLGFISS